jgi:hypothetical protein
MAIKLSKEADPRRAALKVKLLDSMDELIKAETEKLELLKQMKEAYKEEALKDFIVEASISMRNDSKGILQRGWLRVTDIECSQSPTRTCIISDSSSYDLRAKCACCESVLKRPGSHSSFKKDKEYEEVALDKKAIAEMDAANALLYIEDENTLTRAIARGFLGG